MTSCIQIPYFTKKIMKFEKNVSLFVSIPQILLISCKRSLVFNSRIGAESESTTINETLRELFLWARVNEHLPTTQNLELLCAKKWLHMLISYNLRLILIRTIDVKIFALGVKIQWPLSILAIWEAQNQRSAIKLL